jgi:hypothetical protein
MQEAGFSTHSVQVAVLAMEDMLLWMEEGGQVGIFNATNSTNACWNMLLKLAAGKCKVPCFKNTPVKSKH